MTVTKCTWCVIGRRRVAVTALMSSLALSVSLLTLLAASSCGSRDYATNGGARPTVAVSILPQKWFVDKISGGKVQAEVLLPAGRSPATYEPGPSQMTRLAKAAVIFAAGVPYEQSALPKLSRALPNPKIVITSLGLDFRSLEQGHMEATGDSSDHMHSAGDPHTWLDPDLARHHCEIIADELAAIDPKNADLYRRNFAALSDTLAALRSEIVAAFAPWKGKALYVYHPAWGYLTDLVGLRQVPLETEGKEPGPQQLAAFVAQAKTDQARMLLVQRQFSPRTAQVFADEVGARVITADPLAYDYVDNLRQLTAELISQFASPASGGKRDD